MRLFPALSIHRQPPILNGNDGTVDGVVAVPKLDLSFLGGVLPAGVTFTRSTTGTYFNADGVLATAAINAPRFDFDPLTSVRRGLLIEGARTNLCLRSEELDNGSWLKTRASVTANAASAPNGAATADKVVEDGTAANTHAVQQAFTTTASAAYTWSCFIKAAERTKAQVRFQDTGTSANRATVDVDLVAGTLSAVTVAGTYAGGTASIVALPNGWFRVSIRFTVGADTSTSGWFFPADAAGSITYDGNGTSGIYVWGAQLEQAAFESSYIATTSATVTRGSDYCYTTVGDVYGSALSMFAEYRIDSLDIPAGQNRVVLDLTSGADTADEQGLYIQSTGTSQLRCLSRHNTSGLVANPASGATNPTGVVSRAAYSARQDNFIVTRDSEAAGTDTLGVMAATPLTAFSIGCVNNTTTQRLFGWMRRAILWNVALPSATLSYLTR